MSTHHTDSPTVAPVEQDDPGSGRMVYPPASDTGTGGADKPDYVDGVVAIAREFSVRYPQSTNNRTVVWQADRIAALERQLAENDELIDALRQHERDAIEQRDEELADAKAWAAGWHTQRESLLAKLAAAVADTNGVYADIRTERVRQDAQWGGPAHDDDHEEGEWYEYRMKFENRILNYGLLRGQADYPTVHRDALLKIAALAVAQIEALDRKHFTTRSGEGQTHG